MICQGYAFVFEYVYIRVRQEKSVRLKRKERREKSVRLKRKEREKRKALHCIEKRSTIEKG